LGLNKNGEENVRFSLYRISEITVRDRPKAKVGIDL